MFMEHNQDNPKLEDWFKESEHGWLTPKSKLSPEEAFNAVGLRENQIALIKRSQLAGNMNAQSVIREQKMLSSERLAAMIALIVGKPWLPWTKLMDVDGIKEIAERKDIYVSENAVPIYISDDGVVHYLISDGAMLSDVKLEFSGSCDLNKYKHEPSFLVGTPKTISIIYYRYFKNERQKVIDEFSRAAEDPMKWVSGFGHLLTECVYQEGGVENIYLEPGPSVGQVYIQVEGIRRHLHSFSLEHEPNGGLGGVYGRIINLITNDLRANERELSVPGALSQALIPENLQGRFDFRVELKKTIHGWASVLRPFDLQSDIADIDFLGFDAHTYKRLKTIVESPYGLFLIAGPTSSGKNTTAISLLYATDAITRSIQTIEHPVEVRVGSWQQHQISVASVSPDDIDNDQRIYTDSLLRSAPQVIYWGESRNADALYRAMTAANTGHFTLSTYHAPDAAAAIMRMRNERTRRGDNVDMSTAKDLLIGILSQRLLRKICPYCSVPEDRPHVLDLLTDSDIDTEKARMAGHGCDRCHGAGYAGRLLAYELFEPDEDIDLATADRKEIRSCMKHSLYTSGLERIGQGLTSYDEVSRVLGEIKR